MRIGLWRYGLQFLFVAIALIGVMLAIIRGWIAEPPTVKWRTFSMSEAHKSLKKGQAVLVLVEGRPGGMHKLHLTNALVDSYEFRTFVESGKLLAFRVDCRQHADIWDELNVLGCVPSRNPPLLIMMRNGLCASVELDLNSDQRQLRVLIRLLRDRTTVADSGP